MDTLARNSLDSELDSGTEVSQDEGMIAFEDGERSTEPEGKQETPPQSIPVPSDLNLKVREEEPNDSDVIRHLVTQDDIPIISLTSGRGCERKEIVEENNVEKIIQLSLADEDILLKLEEDQDRNVTMVEWGISGIMCAREEFTSGRC